MTNSIYVFDGNGNPTVTAVMATSGTFVMGYDVRQLEQQAAPRSEVANPMMVQPAQYNILETTAPKLIYELKNAFKDARIITPEQIASYADQLVVVATNLAERPIDFMIVPYRGGLTPSLHLQVMNKFQYPHIPLGFSQGSQERNRQNIEDEVVWNLEQFRDRKHLLIGVIDAAIRGDSSLKLADVLKSAKRHFDKQRWKIVFHLLHSEEKYRTPPFVREIPNFNSDGIQFEVELHPVASLLVEDWDEGIGLRADWQNGICYYKATTDGQVISKLPDGNVAVLHSNNLPALIHSFIAHSVTDSMLTNPALTLKPNN
jgi:hypothetical protein